jgi:hypothetical protein
VPKQTFKCNRCTKTFATKTTLRNHQRHHKFARENPQLKPHGKVWNLNGYQTSTITKRPVRSFANDRISQVLRHISTQLWAFCKDVHKTTMVEVEAMYAGGNVYVGANAREHSRLIFKVLSCESTAREVLRYTAGGKSMLAERTERFAKKLRRLRKTEYDVIEIERFEPKKIMEILLKSVPTWLDSATDYECLDSFGTTGNLYVVYYSREGRCNHVEEKFMDVLSRAGHKDGAVVAGKMRPCATCFGRMRFMNQLGFSVEHSQHPGFLWLGRLLEQKPKIQKLTLEKYKKVGSHITEYGGGGYGSESDSSGESDIEED